MRTCKTCPGQRVGKSPYCDPCRLEAKRQSSRKYRGTPAYQESQLRYRTSPKAKIKRSEYQDAHREQRLASYRKFNAKRRRSGRRVQCATILCSGSFIRTERGGRRMYCTSCQLIFGLTTSERRARHKRMRVAA